MDTTATPAGTGRTAAPYRTERLELRAWEAADRDDHFAIYSHWDVMRWLGPGPKPLTAPDQSAAGIERWAGRRDDPYGLWAVVPHDVGRPVGSVLLVPLQDGEGHAVPEVEVGWHFHPDHWGHGYATESAQVLLDQAWASGLEEVWAVVHHGNDRSVAVTERLGMEPMGVTDRWYGMELDAFRLARPHQGP
jgi:RimJ/RimL family protein N-acetyltransferase